MKATKTPLDLDQEQLLAILDLYDNAPCGTLMFQHDGLLLDVNNTFAAWLGFNKEELIQERTFPSLLKPGGQIFFETHFYPLLLLQGFVKEIYFDIQKKDNTFFRGLINVRQIPSSQHEEKIYQAIIIDVSDRYKYEEELRKAKSKAEKDSQAKAEFLATISHEIRTPLNSIFGVGNLLQRTRLNDTQKEYTQLLMHSSQHLLGLVNNFLDLSKIEANKLDIVEEDFNLHDFLRVIAHTFQLKAVKQNLQLKVNIGDNVPKAIVGDPVKLKQILTNLIGNAFKFTREGEITITIKTLKAKKQKSLLQFSVTDTGIGIPEDKLDVIFKEFTQANYDISAETGGTGLGLTICTKLLELHDSKLEVFSSLGVGTTFSFEILYKISNKKLEQLTPMASEAVLPSFEKYNVLIVDDNPSNVFITSQYLAQLKIPYNAVLSGPEALAHLKDNRPDLILLDLQMPRMDGFELLNEIKELSINPKPYIVAFSASGYHELKYRITNAGFDDYLSKPFPPEDLLKIISKNITSRGSEVQVSKKEPQESDGDDLKKIIKVVNPKSNDYPESSRFKTIKFEKMATKKPEYFVKFLASTAEALKGYKLEFKKAIDNESVGDLSDLIHKSTMTLFYIEANKLKQYLETTRETLKSKNKSLARNISKCLSEFDYVLKQLEILITANK